MNKILVYLGIALVSLPALGQNEAILSAERDNTLYFSQGGELSNGSGEHFFAGATREGALRRGLIQFDIGSAIPQGSIIDSVALTLHVSLAPNISTSHDFSLHRVLQEWGEGPSDAGEPGGLGTESFAGDATWVHAILGESAWENEGGDFEEEVSAVADIPSVRNIFPTWSSEGMVQDVQSWLDDTTMNFGWIIIGDENDTQTARRFDTREEQDERLRPELYVRYTTPVSNKDVLGIRKVETYPNPAKNNLTLTLELTQAQEVEIKLFNLIGQPVKQLNVPFAGTYQQHTFDVKSFTPGLYFIRIYTREGVTTRKIIIER